MSILGLKPKDTHPRLEFLPCPVASLKVLDLLGAQTLTILLWRNQRE